MPSLEDIRHKLALGLDPGTPGETAGGWLDGWLDGKRRTKRASTVRGYETHIRVYIKPVIGELPLERVNTGHVEAVLAGVPGSAGTRHRVLATLRAALSAAVKQRRIAWNPCAGIELEAENPPEAKRWTPAEAARFIAGTASDPLGLAFRVMVLSGCRRGELAGLRWDDADLDQGVLTVSRTLLQLGGKLTEGKPKTRAGERLIFLDAETAGLLRDHHDAHVLQALEADDAWQDHGLIFCKPDGQPWNPDHVSRRFKRLAAQAGVPRDQAPRRRTAHRQLADAGRRGGAGAAHAHGRPLGPFGQRSLYACADRGPHGRRRADCGTGPQGRAGS